ncbi:MAG TPA: flagellar motor protein MotB, partial [Spirochaetota bacterium]|nr:flagellar motor protein MotB [Spirochaetota bacterium]
MPKKQKKERKGAAPWMVTYGDMTTLLLVFFVMLIAAGDVKIVKQMVILSAFEGKMGLLQG